MRLGRIPLEWHLASLDERFSRFTKITPETVSHIATRFSNPQKYEITCPIDPLTDRNKQNVVSLAFHANELSDGIFEDFAVRILFLLLTSGHSAPLHKALIDTNIGTDLAASEHSGVGNTAYVSFTLRGVADGDEPRVESEIMRVLEELPQAGFESYRIEGIIHQFELDQKHQTGNFGLRILANAVGKWFDGLDPIETLQLAPLIERLRQEIASGPFFQNLIRKYFLENRSRLTLIMRPDSTFAAVTEAKENALLSKKLGLLSQDDKKIVYEQGIALKETQEKPEDLSVLPSLTVRDIPIKAEDYPVRREAIGQVPVTWRIAPTNGITYVRALSSLNGLPSHLRPYLPLFADALSSLGTVTKSAGEFEDEIMLKTDGLSAKVMISTNHSGTSL